MSCSSPFKAAYQTLLSRGRLRPDKGQAELVGVLDLLQNRLVQGDTSRQRGLVNGTAARSSGGSSSNHSITSDANNGIYIYGGVGTGKSRIADLFTSTLPDQISRRRAHFFEFMTDMHMRLHHARSQAYGYSGSDPLISIGQTIRHECRVLCLDEFQVSDIADAMMLKRLLGSFWDAGGIMLATSNRHPRDLYKDGLNRDLFIPFIEELQRRCLVFRMPGAHDYRMNVDGEDAGHADAQSSPGDKRRKETFFHDRVQFDRALARSLAGRAVRPVEIKVVMGRSFTVQAARSEGTTAGSGSRSKSGADVDVDPGRSAVVSTTFQELCETALGAADYHALCAVSQSIYMSGLRQFGSDELDVIRRFIVLVDVAYESRTSLICLSQVPLPATFENIVDPAALEPLVAGGQQQQQTLDMTRDRGQQGLRVRGQGGSSSSMMSTFIGDTEWSATGLKEASLATGGAGEKDVRFAIRRAISRLTEMGSSTYAVKD